jgi:peroxiredoxin Q/BCP
LQHDLKSIEEAGIQIVGISYDSRDVLKKFTEQAKITFPLLSDPDSKTIEQYHIPNTDAKRKAVGVHYPGTFIVDARGVIRGKLFLAGYRERHSIEALIKAGTDR